MAEGLELIGQRRRRWWGLALACLMLTFVLSPALSSLGTGRSATVRAQDDDEEPAAAAADPADAPPAKEAPKKADEPEDAAQVKPPESFLTWLLNASGVFGICIFIESFLLIGLIITFILQLRMSAFIPPEFVEAFEQKLQAKDYQGAFELAKKDDSFLARVLAGGLAKLSRGYDDAVVGMQQVGEDENMSLDHKLSYISIIGTTAPMLGLLGTVQGMVMAFDEIATSTVSPKPSELAYGITLALVTTLEGLIVAIPAIISFSLFKNRQARLVLEAGMLADGLMGRFATVGKRPASTSAGTTATPAATVPVATAPVAPAS
jgi:biopolymer transport protein ExbB